MIFSVCALLCVALVDIAYPLFNKYAIDHFIIPGTTQGLGWYFVLYVLAVVFQSAGVMWLCIGSR